MVVLVEVDVLVEVVVVVVLVVDVDVEVEVSSDELSAKDVSGKLVVLVITDGCVSGRVVVAVSAIRGPFSVPANIADVVAEKCIF